MSRSTEDNDNLGPPTVQEVGDGLFAYVQPDGSWCINNTGFLVDRSGVVVVDTCATERRSRSFLEAVGGVTDRPVRTLVNTHHHIDHTFGNWLLPVSTIIGHHGCRDEVIASGLRTTAVFPGVEFGQGDVTPPFVTFETSLRVWVRDRPVELRHLGPAHTTNDIIAWVPDDRVLYAGDLLFNRGTPFVLMGSVVGSLAALDQLRALGAERIVPGHGPVGGPELIEEVAGYLRFVRDLAERASADGVPALDAARDADLGEYAAWLDRERLVGNLHRALSELRGEPLGCPLDLMTVWAQMVEYNDGRPLRCLA